MRDRVGGKWLDGSRSFGSALATGQEREREDGQCQTDSNTPVAARRVTWPSPIRGLTSNSSLVVGGLVRLNLGGYVLAAGAFTLNRSTATVETVSADLLTIDLT